MRGAMYLFPLYANASDGEASDGKEQVHPLPAPPWATEDTTTSESFDVTQLAAMLANVQSDLVYVEAVHLQCARHNFFGCKQYHVLHSWA